MTNNTTLKATVTLVKIGVLEIEGLLLDDGRFAIAQQQIASLFSVIPTSAPKWLKSLLGNDFQLFSVKTNRNIESRQNRSEKALLLTDLERLIFELALKGNETAISISRALIGLSLQQLFCDAFGIKFEQAERQEWLKQRQKGKVVRRTLTDAIKDWLDKHPECTGNERTYLYASTTNVLYQSLFGKTAQEMRQAASVATNDLLRDSLSDKQLHLIDYHESYACKMIDKFDTHPHDAIKEAVAFYE